MPEHTPAPTPGRAVYGFAMYLSFRIFFILYLTWAILPEDWLKMIGITCLPQRYWAITIPVFLLSVLWIFAFLIYPNLGWYALPNVDDLRTVQDTHSIKTRVRQRDYKVDQVGGCSCVDKTRCFKESFERDSGDFVVKSVPALQGLPIWEVSDYLYFKQ